MVYCQNLEAQLMQATQQQKLDCANFGNRLRLWLGSHRRLSLSNAGAAKKIKTKGVEAAVADVQTG